MTSSAIVTVVLIACVTGLVMHYISEKNKTAERGEGEDIGDVLEQLDAIEERVRVLERIVTENRVDLKREIDRL